jgi:DNA-binding PadR family transcriptional regulator
MKQTGMLELAVLGLLKERSMHGYELRKQLTAKLGPLWHVSWGSLYPALRRLARRGAVEKVADNGPALGPGRHKTVYRITSAGEDLFDELLRETGAVPDPEMFALKVAFFRYLQPEMRVAMLERRRIYLQDKLAQFRANLRDYRERIDSYALSLQDHGMAVVEEDIEWIDGLISKEKSLHSPLGGDKASGRRAQSKL